MWDIFQGGIDSKDFQKCAVQGIITEKSLLYRCLDKTTSSTWRKIYIPKGTSRTHHVCVGFFLSA